MEHEALGERLVATREQRHPCDALERPKTSPAPARGYSGDDGNFGPNIARGGAAAQGGVEVLSDTMGVNCDPYLKRIVQIVNENWHTPLPESV